MRGSSHGLRASDQNYFEPECMITRLQLLIMRTDQAGHSKFITHLEFDGANQVTEQKPTKRAGIPNKGNVDPVNDGDVTNNISFLRLC
ncbi:hypothetical protein MYU51_020249 [Penicillium brevicompactum]